MASRRLYSCCSVSRCSSLASCTSSSSRSMSAKKLMRMASKDGLFATLPSPPPPSLSSSSSRPPVRNEAGARCLLCAKRSSAAPAVALRDATALSRLARMRRFAASIFDSKAAWRSFSSASAWTAASLSASTDPSGITQSFCARPTSSPNALAFDDELTRSARSESLNSLSRSGFFATVILPTVRAAFPPPSFPSGEKSPPPPSSSPPPPPPPFATSFASGDGSGPLDPDPDPTSSSGRRRLLPEGAALKKCSCSCFLRSTAFFFRTTSCSSRRSEAACIHSGFSFGRCSPSFRRDA